MITAYLAEYLTGPVLKILGIALAILSVIIGARQWGKHAERIEQTQQGLSLAFQRAKINRSVGDGSTANDSWLRSPANR